MPFADRGMRRGTRRPLSAISLATGRRLATSLAALLLATTAERWTPEAARDCGDRGFHVGLAWASENSPSVADARSAQAAGTAADAGHGSAGQSAATPFQTEEISIGQPITLPLAAPPQTGTTRAGGAATAPPEGITRPPESRAVPAAMADAGSGWLGLAVDDSLLTGRLVIVAVTPDSPASRAGVRPQDLLLAIDGNTLQHSDQWAAALAAIMPGQRVTMAIGRDNSVEDIVAVASRRPAATTRAWQPADAAATAGHAATAGQLLPAAAPPADRQPRPSVSEGAPATGRSSPPPALSSASPPGRTALGVRTIPVDSDVQSRFRLSDKRGAFVIGVVHDLPASRAGVPPGSVIVAIDQQPVGSPADLTQLVTRGPVGKPVSLHYVLPGGQEKEAEVVLQSLDRPLEWVLVGGDAGVEPPRLQPTPSLSRRPVPAPGTAESAGGPEPLARLETLLRRINGRLEQIERRLDAPR